MYFISFDNVNASLCLNKIVEMHNSEEHTVQNISIIPIFLLYSSHQYIIYSLRLFFCYTGSLSSLSLSLSIYLYLSLFSLLSYIHPHEIYARTLFQILAIESLKAMNRLFVLLSVPKGRNTMILNWGKVIAFCSDKE